MLFKFHDFFHEFFKFATTLGLAVTKTTFENVLFGKNRLSHIINLIYYTDTSVLLENIPLVTFIKTTSGTRVVYFP